MQPGTPAQLGKIRKHQTRHTSKTYVKLGRWCATQLAQPSTWVTHPSVSYTWQQAMEQEQLTYALLLQQLCQDPSAAAHNTNNGSLAALQSQLLANVPTTAPAPLQNTMSTVELLNLFQTQSKPSHSAERTHTVRWQCVCSRFRDASLACRLCIAVIRVLF